MSKRLYLFRGIDKQTKKFVYGLLVYNIEGALCIQISDKLFRGYSVRPIIEETVGEFTGFKDKEQLIGNDLLVCNSSIEEIISKNVNRLEE